MSKQVREIGSIIGERTDYSGDVIPVFNKYNGEVLANVRCASREVVEEAVAEAVRTFRTTRLTPSERSGILLEAARLVRERREEFALSMVREVGRTIRDCRVEVDRLINTLTISAEEAKRIAGHGVPIDGLAGHENRLAFTVRVPVGVIGAITPFNNPLNLTAHKIGPAIAAGNAVVLKPAEVSPITVMMLADVLREAGLPPGFLNVVNGLGGQTGQYLLEDERVNMYTFTGSLGVGKHIKQTTGIRKVTLELGSNSPTIVHKDADNLDEISQICAMRGFTATNGQACISVQRLYVHADIHNEFVAKLVGCAERIKMGDPELEETDLGPLISEKEAKRIEEWVNEAVVAGARIVCGGRRSGVFFQPTVLTNVDAAMKVMCKEVFGPVINVVAYDDVDEVFRQVNDSEFGLQAGLFTSSLPLAMRAVYELEFGGVMINDVSTYRSDAMPYGGTKNSGLGKEGPRYAIEEMTDERIVVMKL